MPDRSIAVSLAEPTRSNLPLIALTAVIALWYVCGAGLVLLGVL